jgi:hypothetical protein
VTCNFKTVLKGLTSLRLTVICLCFAIALVFIGTLAQVDQGLYNAQARYFRSMLVWWSPTTKLCIPIFPGGYLVGGALLLNLIAAHIARFKFSKNKIGILLSHFGLIVLLLGQFATDLLSREGNMQLFEGEAKNYSEAFRATELAIVDTSDADNDRVYAVADTVLEKTKEIQSPKLPFTIRVKNFYPNAAAYVAEASNVPPMAKRTEANAGEFQTGLVLPMPATGDPETRNLAAAVVELLQEGKAVGTFLLSVGVNPQSFTIQGKSYEIALRFEREYYPFSLTLLKATHETYKGTDIPKNFASRIRVADPQKHEARETLISMNNPLRYQGITFFQYQMAADQMTRASGRTASSTFQVVHNPSWATPYLACAMIGVGLVVQFMTHLLAFAFKTRRELAASKLTQPVPEKLPNKSVNPAQEVPAL